MGVEVSITITISYSYGISANKNLPQTLILIILWSKIWHFHLCTDGSGMSPSSDLDIG